MSEEILMNIAEQIRNKVEEANDNLEHVSIREEGEDFLYVVETLTKELHDLMDEMVDVRQEMNI